jgi:hypothetical protein
VRLLAPLIAASLMAGCWTNPHCGVDYCTGSSLHTCSIEGNDAGRVAVWQSMVCTGACVTAKGAGAFCTLSKTPIAECATDGQICYHGAAAVCLAGYLQSSMACSSACAVAQGSSFCALTSGPVAECTQDGSACYQGSIGTCRAGYVVSSMACASGSTCASAGSCGPICALATTPDASCPPPSGANQMSSYCDGNTQVSCQCGYGLGRTDCGTAFCIAMGGDAMCALSSMTDPRCKAPATAFCDNNTLYSCWNGYAVSPQPCGTGTCMVDTTGGLGTGCYYKSG